MQRMAPVNHNLILFWIPDYFLCGSAMGKIKCIFFCFNVCICVVFPLFTVEVNINLTIESCAPTHCLLGMREQKCVSVPSISISIWICILSLSHTLTHKPIYFSNPSLSTLCIQKCYLASLYLRTGKHMLNLLRPFAVVCDVSAITKQSCLDVMYNCYCIQCKVLQMSPWYFDLQTRLPRPG